MVRSVRFIGEWKDHANGRLDEYVNNTLVGRWDDAGKDLTLPTNGLAVIAGGILVTAGGEVITAGDLAVTVGNYRAGPINTFGTTEPTQAIVIEAGTAPVGAITTSNGIYSTATTLNKIIAGGTANTIQT